MRRRNPGSITQNWTSIAKPSRLSRGFLIPARALDPLLNPLPNLPRALSLARCVAMSSVSETRQSEIDGGFVGSAPLRYNPGANERTRTVSS